MKEKKGKPLGTATLVIALSGLAVVVMTSAATFIGGTKIRPLFGMSEEALGRLAAGSSLEEATATDAGTVQRPDAGDAATVATP